MQRLLKDEESTPSGSVNSRKGPGINDPAFERARSADREAIFSLLTEAGLTTAGIAEDPGPFFVVRTPSGVAGVVGLEYYGEYTLLRSLAVAPAHRGKGLGRRLTVLALEAVATKHENYLHVDGTKNLPASKTRLVGKVANNKSYHVRNRSRYQARFAYLQIAS